MRAGNTHGLAVRQTAHLVPVHLGITKARPAVRLAFVNKRLPAATNGSLKEWLAGIGIVKGDGFLGIARLLQKFGLFKVASVLSPVAVKVADAIGRLAIRSPAKVLLDWSGRGAVSLGAPRERGMMSERTTRNIGSCLVTYMMLSSPNTGSCVLLIDGAAAVIVMMLCL